MKLNYKNICILLSITILLAAALTAIEFKRYEKREYYLEGIFMQEADRGDELYKMVSDLQVNKINMQLELNGYKEVAELTGYGINCKGCIGITSTGYDVRNAIYFNPLTKKIDIDGLRIVAVNPEIIPYGSVIEIEYYDYLLKEKVVTKAIALDTGKTMRDHNEFTWIDLLWHTEKEANEHTGRQPIKWKYISKGE